MFRKYRILKWVLLGLGTLIAILVIFGFWFMSLLPPRALSLEQTKVQELTYVMDNVPENRGKVLAVVTSVDVMGKSGKRTGYELTELARAYYVFQANGYEVDIASPAGGEPPVVIDDEDMGPYDFAFLNDSIAQKKTSQTLSITDVSAANYEAIFFVGGKGAMFDFPDNKKIQAVVRKLYESDKVIGAVCHGPAALVNVTLTDGTLLLDDKTVSGFTNDEELLLIPEAESIFPFLLQDKMTAQGASFNKGAMYLEKVSHDKNLVTGQNPWSVWSVAELMIEQMGHVPKFREITGEENAVDILNVYDKGGSQPAKEMIAKLIQDSNKPVDRILIAKHGIIAAMKGEIGKFFNMVGLVSFAKKVEGAPTE
ncbi:type 1 glutamine amidotransferase domain-containing protein [uncultured Croceitalea sp.]|uniref:type 1 glutamine amidotransferase domain-containing protein n=1 Tax=uncultured Croceitalea sp. TaxID=1798908 RepID=UPI003305F1F4